MMSCSSAENWQAEPLETAVKAFAEGKDLKLGKVAQPLRAALTGRTHVSWHLRCADRAWARRISGPHAATRPPERND